MIYIFLTIGLLRWGGFIDGDGSFSTNKHVPRFKLENHVKELELFRRIKEYFNSGNLLIVPPRKNRLNHNSMVVLEINNIHVLKNLILPFLSKNNSKLSLSLALCSRFLFFFFSLPLVFHPHLMTSVIRCGERKGASCSFFLFSLIPKGPSLFLLFLPPFFFHFT